MNIKHAASEVGISEGLLILWINTGKFKPSIEISTANNNLKGTAKKAFESFAPDGEAFGWNRFQFTDSDVDRLRGMVEQTAQQKAKVEVNHVKGAAYTPQELAVLWSLSEDTIREVFKDEPGVIRITNKPTKKNRKAYTSIRIPEDVAARVQRRLSA
jgi:hypothetical protein